MSAYVSRAGLCSFGHDNKNICEGSEAMLPWWKTTALCLTAISVMAIGVNDALCQVLKANVAQITNLSTDIVVGRVVRVTDGIASDNLPHTEVTLSIDQTLKGTLSGTYIFWQFGLIKPRDMGNGMVNLNVTPAGWPRYAKGEEVMLFMNQQAALTRLRSTVGQFQGKFLIFFF